MSSHTRPRQQLRSLDSNGRLPPYHVGVGRDLTPADDRNWLTASVGRHLTTPRASVEVDQRLITPLPRLATSVGKQPFGAACTAV